jgi:hypothetical protein
VTLPGTDEWTSNLLAGWVRGLVSGLLPDVAVAEGPELPDMGRVIVVTLTAGAGDFMDGFGESPGFQMRCRGAQNNRGDAEAIAFTADKAIKFAPFPAWVGNVRLTSVQRLGDRPAPLSGQPDAGRRYHYVSTYITQIL